MKYHERMDVLHAQLVSTRELKGIDRHNAVAFNNKFMLDNREGDFIIQIKDGYWDQLKSNLYIGTCYVRGSMGLGTRRHAAWFKADEVKEVLAKIGPRWKVTRITKSDRARKHNHGW